MDHRESKATDTESSYKLSFSPVKQQSLLANPNSQSDVHVGTKKLECEYDRETKVRRYEKSSVKDGKFNKESVTESSSSNTPHVIHRASSNDSCRDTSLEIQSCKLGKVYAAGSSTCTELKYNFKESAIRSLKPGTKMQNLGDDNLGHTSSPAKQGNVAKESETIESFRASNSDNLSGMRSSDNLSGMSSENNYAVLENIDQVKKEDVKSDSCKLDVAPAVEKGTDHEFEASVSSFVSINLSRTSCVTETGSITQLQRGQDESFIFCTRLLARNESLCSEVKGFSSVARCKESRDVNDDGLQWKKSSSQTMKAEDGLSRDCSRIDLNEDMSDHDAGFLEWSEKENVPNLRITVSKPKPVMAKPGAPFFFLQSTSPNNGKPSGWRGSFVNSAFQPTSFAKSGIVNKALSVDDDSGITTLRAFECVDLNLDAVAESEPEYVHDEPIKARTLDFDLNCLGENEDNFLLSCPENSLSVQSVRDFDLNDNIVHVDTSNYPHSEAMRKTGPRQQDFQTLRPVFPADLHSVPGFIPAHVRPFLVGPANILHSNEQLQRVSFLQSQHLGYAPNLPCSSRIDSKDGLVTQNLLPHANTVVSQMLGSGPVPAFPGHVFHVPHGLSTSNIAVGNRDIHRGASSGQLLAPLTSPTMEDRMKGFQQRGVSGPGMKRREPEGGWDSHQLRFTQMTSWQ